MSEQAPRHEAPLHQVQSHERSSHPAERQAERHHPHTEARNEDSPSLESIRHRVEQEAVSKERIPRGHEQQHARREITGSISPEIALATRNRLLKHIRAHLSLPDRVFSRIIHQPAVDYLSELGSKTIARPSALLSGSVCAFLGSIILLYISNRYGYAYNFLIFSLLFVGGFVVGLIIEGLTAALRRTRS